MFFKFRAFEAPSRFEFKDPDTGRQFVEASKQALIDRITAYRQVNNLEPIEHLSFVLESYWCQLPANIGKCQPIEHTPRGTFGYFKGGLALLTTVLYKQFAPQKVADERSRQCAGCKFNVVPQTEGWVGWANSLAKTCTDGKKSEKHDELGQCNVCTCPLRSKVFYTGEVESKPEWKAKFKEVNCWQLGLMKDAG